jgi:hypothetical protein
MTTLNMIGLGLIVLGGSMLSGLVSHYGIAMPDHALAAALGAVGLMVVGVVIGSIKDGS